MSSFDEREKGFEKKFAHDEEIQFKVMARRNKYLGEWGADQLGKSDKSKEEYISAVIKSDFAEPGDEDVFLKIKKDFEDSNIKISDNEIRIQMTDLLHRAKKDFI